MSTVTIGCDPEFFIMKGDTSTVVPICGLLGGTKEEPIQIPGMNNGFMMQEDGIAAEFNIPPADNARDFYNSVSSALLNIGSILNRKGYQASIINNLELQPEWCKKFPNIEQIGCDPDYIAYEQAEGPKERVATPDKVGLIRGAGGHVHIGYPQELCPPYILAQLCDLTLALPLLGNDRQGKRRSFWGLAGLYRPKPYGMEYRTLSNFWIWSGSACATVGSTSLALVESIKNKIIRWQALHNGVNWAAVRDIIYREDVRAAKQLINTLSSQYPVYREVLQRGTLLGG